MPERVQLSRKKGWRMPPNTVKVDRTTKWGNPFRPNRRQDRDYCVTLFSYLMSGLLCFSGDPSLDEQSAYRKMVSDCIGELRGKNLACWCRLDQACHADVLLKMADQHAESVLA